MSKIKDYTIAVLPASSSTSSTSSSSSSSDNHDMYYVSIDIDILIF